MPQRKGLLAPQNTFLDTIATRFDGTHSNFVLGNAQVKEYPIVYCSDGFVELSGFGRSQIMSRSCSCAFLWGPRTNDEAKDNIWSALKVHTELKIEVFFHKKNGVAFNCLLDIVPIKNEKGQVVLFLVSHKDLSMQKRPGGHSSSLLSCGLASTMAAAALVTNRQPNLQLPSVNHIPQRSIPARRPLLPSPPKSSSIVTRRASAPHPNTSGTVHRVRFSSSSGLPGVDVTDPNYEQLQQRRADTCLSMLSTESLRRQSEVDTRPSAQPSQLTDTESISESSLASSSKKPGESSSDSETDNHDDDDDCEDDSSERRPSNSLKYTRRRSRAVLYHLSGRFDKKSKQGKLNFKRVLPHLQSKNSMPEYKVQELKASRCILLHYSILKIVWDWLIVLCTFYFALMVPYNAAFQKDTHERTLRTLDMIIEVLFIVDILLNFRTTFVSKSGQVVHQSKEIAVNYIKGWFVLDLIAAVPFDVIWTIQSPESPVANWMHLMKLARLLRLARLFQKIERYSQYSAVVLGLLMCMFFLLAHWFACGWFGLGSIELLNPQTRNHSWLFELSERTDAFYGANMTGGPNDSSIYISSLYFMMSSLTSVGFGNVSPNTTNEKIFSIISMLVGALMHAAVFGNVTTIIQRMYTRRSAYQTKSQDLKDFTRAHHLPKQLRQRMMEFFQAMWSINRGIDKQTIMQVFPEEMRGDIALHINREMLSLSIFKAASIGCQKSIAQLIGTRFSTPGEFLVHRGDAIKYLYFVCSGSLEILDEEGSVVALLGKCDLFGTDIDDRPFLGLSAYDVKALTYCELQYITLDTSLFTVLNLYPNYSKNFVTALHDELSFNIKEGYDPFANDDVEILAAITKPRSPPPESPPGSPVIEVSSEIERCPSLSTRHDLSVGSADAERAMEEGNFGKPGPVANLFDDAPLERCWYIGDEVNSGVVKVPERQMKNLSMDSCLLVDSNNSGMREDRRVCSLEQINLEFAVDTRNQSHINSCLHDHPTSSTPVSQSIEHHDLKPLLLNLFEAVGSMRAEIRSLATELSTVKEILALSQLQPKQSPLPQSERVKKPSIMKSTTFTAFSLETSPLSTPSSVEICRRQAGCCQKNCPTPSNEKSNANIFFCTDANVHHPHNQHNSRCVKFDLPAKSHRHNWRKQTRRSSTTSAGSGDFGGQEEFVGEEGM